MSLAIGLEKEILASVSKTTSSLPFGLSTPSSLYTKIPVTHQD